MKMLNLCFYKSVIFIYAYMFINFNNMLQKNKKLAVFFSCVIDIKVIHIICVIVDTLYCKLIWKLLNGMLYLLDTLRLYMFVKSIKYIWKINKIYL